MIDLDIKRVVEYSLWEDLRDIGDITSNALIGATATTKAQVVARTTGVLCGTAYAVETFRQLDKAVGVTLGKSDGCRLKPGDVIAHISGNTRAILAGERTALNFLGHLSGIATATKKATTIAVPYNVKIACTRKTTPMLRSGEKYAVSMGGGETHRFGLYDQALIKDNHLIEHPDIVAATKIIQNIARGKIVQVEVDTLEQLRAVLPLRPHCILLDNMSPSTIEKARLIAGKSVCLEASGNITLDTLETYCQTGVDVISMGSLTHSAKNFDVSMEFFRAPTV